MPIDNIEFAGWVNQKEYACMAQNVREEAKRVHMAQKCERGKNKKVYRNFPTELRISMLR